MLHQLDLKAVQEIRRRIKAEFGVAIQFSDATSVAILPDLFSKSRDDRTRKLISGMIPDFERHYGLSFTSTTQITSKTRIYRGKVVTEPTKDVAQSIVEAQAREEQQKQHKPSKPRIYRGRVISD